MRTTDENARPHPFATPDSARPSLDLATKLQRYPSLKTYGLRLEGDIQLYQGNRSAAKRAYTEAAAELPRQSVDCDSKGTR